MERSNKSLCEKY